MSPFQNQSWRPRVTKPSCTLKLQEHVLKTLTKSATFATSIIQLISLLHSTKVSRRFFPKQNK